MAESKTKEVYFVIDPDNDRAWEETVSISKQQCQIKFAQAWHPRVKIDAHTAWTLWRCYENAGWKIQSFELPGFPKSNH